MILQCNKRGLVDIDSSPDPKYYQSNNRDLTPNPHQYIHFQESYHSKHADRLLGWYGSIDPAQVEADTSWWWYLVGAQ